MILETQTRGGREMGGEKPRSWTQVPAWGLEEPERLQGLVESHIHHAEKALVTHSSTLAWKIPWTEEPGRVQSMGSQRVGHD